MHPTSEGNHLSLFLITKQRNDLPKDSGNLVEFTISIKDLENGKDKKSTGAHLSRSLLDEQKYYKHIFCYLFHGSCAEGRGESHMHVLKYVEGSSYSNSLVIGFMV